MQSTIDLDDMNWQADFAATPAPTIELNADRTLNLDFFQPAKTHDRLATLLARATDESFACLQPLSHSTLLSIARDAPAVPPEELEADSDVPSSPESEADQPPLMQSSLLASATDDWKAKSDQKTWPAAISYINKLDRQSVSHTVSAGSAPMISLVLVFSLFLLFVFSCLCVLPVSKNTQHNSPSAVLLPTSIRCWPSICSANPPFRRWSPA